MLNYVFNVFMALVLFLVIAFGFLERVANLIKLLGSIRLGSRRSSKPTVVSEDENFLIADRECTLLQQWYSDQPVQRLYGMACTATFSRDGIARLRTGTGAPSTFMREAIWLLIRQHPILSSTIVRDAVTSRATARCTVPKTSTLSVDHPLGNLPVEIISRSDDNAWQGTAEDYMRVDMKEDGWLFRIVFVAPEIAAGSSYSGNFDVDIMIIMHHFITDGMFVCRYPIFVSYFYLLLITLCRPIIYYFDARFADSSSRRNTSTSTGVFTYAITTGNG